MSSPVLCPRYLWNRICALNLCGDCGHCQLPNFLLLKTSFFGRLQTFLANKENDLSLAQTEVDVPHCTFCVLDVDWLGSFPSELLSTSKHGLLQPIVAAREIPQLRWSHWRVTWSDGEQKWEFLPWSPNVLLYNL
jgi:hypothetical protein